MIPTLPLGKPELYRYSPHQKSMLLLDVLKAYDLRSLELTSGVNITSSSVFFDPEAGCVPNYVAFEYMAQSIALLSGLAEVDKNSTPKIGFIMGIRDFKTTVPGFTPGDALEVRVKEVFREGSVAVFEGSVFVKDKLVVSAVVNAIEGDADVLEKLGEKAE